MSTPIVVYGAGGHGREVAALIGALRHAGATWNCLGFLSDDPLVAGSSVAGMPVLGGEEWLRANPGMAVALGIGSPNDRKRVAARVASLAGSFPTLVHPTALVMQRTTLEQGVLVFAGAIVSVDVLVGAFASVNTLASISHDCRLGAFATLAPRVTLAGNSSIGEGADLGTGAVSIPGANVGAWSVIGAGAVVVKDIPDHCTAVGVPARVIRTRPSVETALEY